MRLDHERASSLDCNADGNSAHLRIAIIGEEHLRGILHLAETAVDHLIDANLVGGAETILDAAKDTVKILTIALELKDRIDDMLQHLWSGDSTILINMSDEDYGDIRLLGISEESGGALADLRDSAGSRLDVIRADGLNRIDHHETRLDIPDMVEDIFEASFAEDESIVRDLGEAVGTEFKLRGRLLARDIEDSPIADREDILEEEG